MLRSTCFRRVLERVPGSQVKIVRMMPGYRRIDTTSPDRDLQKRRIYRQGDPVEKPKIQPYPRRNFRPGHPELEKYVDEYVDPFPKGKIYDRLPIKMKLEAGKMYAWCTCGYSHNQPFCDGNHKTMEGTRYKKTMQKFRPHRFTVDTEKEYYLCNCKQTDNRPFCDGSHKKIDPKESILRRNAPS